MEKYIDEVRQNVTDVTDVLLDGASDTRISINGVGDHCDGHNLLQMYALTENPAEVKPKE